MKALNGQRSCKSAELFEEEAEEVETALFA